MRRIDASRFRIATRGTAREINSRIALNLVRTHQPISRAESGRMRMHQCLTTKMRGPMTAIRGSFVAILTNSHRVR